MSSPSRALVVRDAPSSLPDKIEYAKYLAEAGLLPSEYRKQPANVLFAMEYGQALGIHAAVAMIGVHVIEGKPSASPALMSALVRRAGHRLRVWLDRKTMTAYAELRRIDDPDFTFRAEWDLDRAVTALLCTIKDGKPYSRSDKGKPLSWEKYPGNMLKWRCVSEVCRDGAEECLMGMHYTPEELGAEVDADGDPLRVVSERVAEPTNNGAARAETRPTVTQVQSERVTEARREPESSAPQTTAAEPAQAERSFAEQPFDYETEVEKCEATLDLDGIRKIYNRAKTERLNDDNLRALIEYAGSSIKERLETRAAADAPHETDRPEETPEQLAERKGRDELRRELFALLGKGGITDSSAGREARLRICSRLPRTNRVPEIGSTDELSDLEVAEIIVALRRYDRAGDLSEQLTAMSAVTE